MFRLGHPRALARLLGMVGLVFVLTGCRVDATVDAHIARDGSGTVAVAVAFDDDALARLGEPATQLRLDDLRSGGWTVTGPTEEQDGTTSLRASKPFRDADEFAAVMGELTGPSGALRAFGFRQSKAFAKTTTEIVGVIDASGGLAATSDAEVAALLGGNPLGRPQPDVQADDANVSLVLTLDAPGSIDGDADEIDGSVARFEIRPGDPRRDIVLRAVEIRSGPRFFSALAAGLGVCAVVALVAVAVLRRYTPRPVGTAAGEAVPAAASPNGAAARARVRAVVLDAMGVIFRKGDDVGSLLVPFVAERGGIADEGLVRERYREASLGRLTSAELWATLGVDGDADTLDDDYTARFELNEGLDEFLDSMARRGIVVACLSNDVAEWADRLRARFALTDRIVPWVVSGEVGARKPDPAVFAALEADLQVPLSTCLLVDDEPTNLDAARSLGMTTALFTPTRQSDVDHRQIRRFADLLARRAAAGTGRELAPRGARHPLSEAPDTH